MRCSGMRPSCGLRVLRDFVVGSSSQFFAVLRRPWPSSNCDGQKRKRPLNPRLSDRLPLRYRMLLAKAPDSIPRQAGHPAGFIGASAAIRIWSRTDPSHGTPRHQIGVDEARDWLHLFGVG